MTLADTVWPNQFDSPRLEKNAVAMRLLEFLLLQATSRNKPSDFVFFLTYYHHGYDDLTDETGKGLRNPHGQNLCPSFQN